MNRFLAKNVTLLAALATSFLVVSSVSAQSTPAGTTNIPSENGKAASNLPSADIELMLIRNSLTAFNQANLTNDYRVMHALGSAGFRAANSADRLGELFAVYRTNKVDLSPILFLNPVLTRPAVVENGRLRLVGSFPSKPMAVNFDLSFEPSEGRWKLFAISVSLAPGQRSAAPRK